jgi:hypothetical protein
VASADFLDESSRKGPSVPGNNVKTIRVQGMPLLLVAALQALALQQCAAAAAIPTAGTAIYAFSCSLLAFNPLTTMEK